MRYSLLDRSRTREGRPEAAALRETCEEIALAPEAVEVLGRLPSTMVTRSFNATVVVGAWSGEQSVRASEAEVAQVLRYPVGVLASPAVRRSARHGGRGRPEQEYRWAGRA